MTTILWIIVVGNALGVLFASKTSQRLNSAAVIALALSLLLGAPQVVQGLAATALIGIIGYRIMVAAVNRWDP